ncbi:hypothetical protein SDC9_35796 [bioreactor metagenome]|uniref:Uncharacterized protein n=1 Tax=bioreactor metagenome TaxID=1076179 RepID=A0A644VEC6_9ZZZZ
MAPLPSSAVLSKARPGTRTGAGRCSERFPVARFLEGVAQGVERAFVPELADQHHPHRQAVDHAAGHRQRRVMRDVEGRGVGQDVEAAFDDLLARGIGARQRRRHLRHRRHQQRIVIGQHRVIGRPQRIGQVMRLAVEALAVFVIGELREDHRELERLGQLVRPLAPAAVDVHEAGDVKILARGAIAVAQHHRLHQPLQPDRGPDVGPVEVHRDRDLLDDHAEILEPLCRGADLVIDRRLGLRMAEALLQQRDLHPLHRLAERLGIGRGLHPDLAAVIAVGAGQHLEHQCAVGDGLGDRAGMVDGDLDRHHAGIGHEAVGGLHADRAAEGRGHADRAALVAADRHVDLALRDQHRRARGGTTGRAARVIGVAHRAKRRGVAAAGHAEAFAMRLADDRRAGIEKPRHQRCIDVRDIALERRGAVHHRHAGQHDVVLQDHGLALQLALGRAGNGRLHIPRIERVLGLRRLHARRARVFHHRQRVDHPVDLVVGGDIAAEQPLDRGHVLGREAEADPFGHIRDLGVVRKSDCHGGTPSVLRGMATRAVACGTAARDRSLPRPSRKEGRQVSGRGLRRSGSPSGGEAHEGADRARVGQLRARDLLLKDAVRDCVDALRQARDELEVLLDEDDGDVDLLRQRRERFRDLVDDRGLDALGRFVEQHQLRPPAQAARQRQKLLLAARERAAAPVEKPLEPGEKLEHLLDGLGDDSRLAGDADLQVLLDAQVREDLPALRHQTDAGAGAGVDRLAEDGVALEADLAAGDLHIAHDRAHQRGLAHAVVAENADHLAAIGVKIDPVQRRDQPVGGRQAGDFKQMRHWPVSPDRFPEPRGRP